VLADVGMPGRNGYEVARYIKQSPKLSHIPVVLLTGAFEPVDQAKAAEAGCDGVLAKPFEPQLVIGRVKELLARSQPVSEKLDVERAPRPAATTEPWTPLGDPSFQASVSQPTHSVSVSDYFDRLDNAFANLSAPAAASAEPASPPSELDWFSAEPKPSTHEPSTGIEPLGTEPADLPLAYSPPAIDFDKYATTNPPPPATALSSPTLPPTADAFAARLSAQPTEPAPAAAPSWPSPPSSAPIATEELVEQVTRRVLEQLSDRVVRETVTDVVSSIAERVVREEIDRIKASIK